MRSVTVIGLAGESVFMDIDHFPIPGQTISCHNISFELGGKGYNQAIAAARMGADVHFIGSVGDDQYGMQCQQELIRENIKPDLIKKSSSTAFAVISTEHVGGENTVQVFRGAAEELNISDLENPPVDSIIQNSSLLLIQNEIPESCISYIIRKAHQYGIYVIWNPAPADHIDPDTLRLCDLITPNQSEARQILKVPENQPLSDEEFQQEFLKIGVPRVLVTLGKEGALYLTPESCERFPAVHIADAVDTTGAGDTFNGVLAAGIVAGCSMKEAISNAIIASGISVTRKGAVAGIPYRDEIMEYRRHSHADE